MKRLCSYSLTHSVTYVGIELLWWWMIIRSRSTQEVLFPSWPNFENRDIEVLNFYVTKLKNCTARLFVCWKWSTTMKCQWQIFLAREVGPGCIFGAMEKCETALSQFPHFIYVTSMLKPLRICCWSSSELVSNLISRGVDGWWLINVYKLVLGTPTKSLIE